MRVLNFNRLLAGLVACAISIVASPGMAADGAAEPNPLAGPQVDPNIPAPAAAPAADPAAPVVHDAAGAGAAEPDAIKPKKGKKKNDVPGGAGGFAGAGAAAEGPELGGPGAGVEGAAARMALPPQVRDLLSRLTVIDQANLELANISQTDGKAEDAAANLAKIYAGKDNEACGAAHLLEAFWLLRAKKNEEAEKHLVQVTGPCAEAAAREIARVAKDDPTHMQANFDTLIQNLTGEKNLAYKGWVIQLAIQQARAANMPDLLTSTLKKVGVWTNPEEALKMREAMEAQLVADYDRAQRLKEMRANRPGAGREGAMAAPGEELAPDAGGPGPRGKRAEAAAGPEGAVNKDRVVEMMKQRAEQARAAGDADKAAKIDAMAEKIRAGEIAPEDLKKRLEERGAGGGPGGPGGKGKGGKQGGEAPAEGRPQPADEAAF